MAIVRWNQWHQFKYSQKNLLSYNIYLLTRAKSSTMLNETPAINCLSVCLSICLSKYPSISFHIFTSSESPSQVPVYIRIGIPRWKQFKFVQLKGHVLCHREILATEWQYIDNFFSRANGPISTKLGTEHPWVMGI